MRPISFRPASVNQRLPSGPATIPPRSPGVGTLELRQHAGRGDPADHRGRRAPVRFGHPDVAVGTGGQSRGRVGDQQEVRDEIDVRHDAADEVEPVPAAREPDIAVGAARHQLGGEADEIGQEHPVGGDASERREAEARIGQLLREPQVAVRGRRDVVEALARGERRHRARPGREPGDRAVGRAGRRSRATRTRGCRRDRAMIPFGCARPVAYSVTIDPPPRHVPAWHVSARVQTSPSLHAVPSGLAGFEQTPVAGLQLPAAWHWSLAVQVTAPPPTQVPAWQLSACVQALPSLHAVPSGAGRVRAGARRRIARSPRVALVARRAGDRAAAHAGARLAAVRLRARVAVVARRPVGAGRVRADARRRVAGPRRVALVARRAGHRVAAHARARLASCPSACTRCRRCTPCRSALVGFEQTPVAGLHIPAAWHWSLAAQVTGLPPTHAPA